MIALGGRNMTGEWGRTHRTFLVAASVLVECMRLYVHNKSGSDVQEERNLTSYNTRVLYLCSVVILALVLSSHTDVGMKWEDENRVGDGKGLYEGLGGRSSDGLFEMMGVVRVGVKLFDSGYTGVIGLCRKGSGGFSLGIECGLLRKLLGHGGIVV
ncbi:hypothetical protein Tco_0193930 [Tanacetum coccineum]